MKVVINRCYGGFALSEKAQVMLKRLGFQRRMGRVAIIAGDVRKYDYEESLFNDMDRADPIMVRVIELLGKEASQWMAQIEVVEIPDGIRWHITENAGKEVIVEGVRPRPEADTRRRWGGDDD